MNGTKYSSIALFIFCQYILQPRFNWIAEISLFRSDKYTEHL